MTIKTQLWLSFSVIMNRRKTFGVLTYALGQTGLQVSRIALRLYADGQFK